MCDPASIGLALSVTSNLVGVAGQNQSADAQAQTQRDNFRRQEVAANNSFMIQAQQENERLAEEAAADSAAIQDVQRDSLLAQAAARVAASEGGVSGLSVRALLDDFRRDEATFINRTLESARFREDQTRRRLESAEATRQGRVNSATPTRPIKRPSFAGAALRIAGAGVDHWRDRTKPGDGEG